MTAGDAVQELRRLAMSEEPEKIESVPSREWMKFIILAVVLVGVIVVIMVTRPFIFNHVVPVVMGEGQLTAPMPVEEPEKNVEEAYPITGDSPTLGPENAYPAETTIPAPAVEEAYPTDNTPDVEEAGKTTISHTVQHGDTILNIARRYNVTVDAIVAANNISNPNHIEVGTTLLIPQP
jgi:nucleoid-associated protein YgaU